MARRPARLSAVPRDAAVPRRRRHTSRWVLVGLASVTTIVLGGDWLVHQPFLRARHVEVLGLRHESRAAVLAVAGLGNQPPMIDVRGPVIAQRLRVFPWIQDVTVTLHWPDTVVIAVREHQPVAVAFDADHVLQYVDASGQELGPAPLHVNLPTLRYIDPRSRTWPFAHAGYNAALVASRLPAAFASQVATIMVGASGSVSLQLTTPVTFLLGNPSDLTDKFVSVASIIAHDTLQAGDVVDVRAPGEIAISGPSAGVKG